MDLHNKESVKDEIGDIDDESCSYRYEEMAEDEIYRRESLIGGSPGTEEANGMPKRTVKIPSHYRRSSSNMSSS